MTAQFDGGERFEGRAMGSPLRLTVVGGPPGAATEAWRQVVEEFEHAEQAMSSFRDSSDLTVANRAAGTGRCLPVDRRLARALVAADRAGRITSGLFDARVLTDLERLGYPGLRRTPGGDDTASPRDEDARSGEASPASSDRWLTIVPGTAELSLARPVDLGGIGKGLALRWAWRCLERAGFVQGGAGALLEAGGDLVAGGPAPQGGPWIIAIEDPAGGDDPIATVEVPSGAVATSSTLVHHWTAPDGRPVHHLIDPRTGEPGGDGLRSVTVAGADPAWAEVWSKSLFLCGADDIAMVARARGLAAWWVHDDGSVEMTPAGRARTTWLAGEA
jgi:FAD:protein FMN transferase